MRKLGFRLLQILLLVGLLGLGLLFLPSALQTVLEMRDQAEQTAASQTTVPMQEYLVQSGDTPNGVALMFGTTVEALIVLNAERYPEMGQTPMKFNAGWRILVPSGSNVADASGGSESQVIQSSENVDATTSEVVASSAEGYFDYEGALEIIRLTNDERVKVGLALLTVDETLMEIARKRAVEIASDWGHQGLFDNCSDCGENIALAGSPKRTLALWLASEEHSNNLLSPDWGGIGIGFYVLGDRYYASQVFR